MERQGSEGGISSRPQGALSLQSSRGGIFSKGCHFSEQVSNCSSVITQKKTSGGAPSAPKKKQVGHACINYIVATPLIN